MSKLKINEEKFQDYYRNHYRRKQHEKTDFQIGDIMYAPGKCGVYIKTIDGPINLETGKYTTVDFVYIPVHVKFIHKGSKSSSDFHSLSTGDIFNVPNRKNTYMKIESGFSVELNSGLMCAFGKNQEVTFYDEQPILKLVESKEICA